MASVEERLKATEERLDRLERDLSFVARHNDLKDVGHATPSEYARMQELKDRFPRYPEETPRPQARPA
jgi:hypothetical protein